MYITLTTVSRSLAASVAIATLALSNFASAAEPAPLRATPDLDIQDANVSYNSELEMVVFELEVSGKAGRTLPTAVGAMDGAPVLGYVFPTSLRPEQVGFAAGDGILALAATSHPDFDDTPLWDEDGDSNPTNSADGRVFHTHWVVLVGDDRVAGGLSVKPVSDSASDELPATAPGMPIYLDSPGFSAILKGNRLRIPVQDWRIRELGTFDYDAVAAYMQVNTSDESRPTLGVYEVYSVFSGDLSLPKTFTLPGTRR